MCCVVRPLWVPEPMYLKTNKGLTVCVKDDRAGKNHAASVQQFCTENGFAIAPLLCHAPVGKPFAEFRTSKCVLPLRSKMTRLSEIPFASNVPAPLSF